MSRDPLPEESVSTWLYEDKGLRITLVLHGGLVLTGQLLMTHEEAPVVQIKHDRGKNDVAKVPVASILYWGPEKRTPLRPPTPPLPPESGPVPTGRGPRPVLPAGRSRAGSSR